MVSRVKNATKNNCHSAPCLSNFADNDQNGAAMRRQLVGILILLCAAFFSGVSDAQTVLTVRAQNSDEAMTFTLAELKQFPQVDVVTKNEFVDGERTFRGPLVRDVLRAENAADAAFVKMTAANDYQIDVKAKEFYDYDVILALSMDGKDLSARDKGPIWVIYPMSQFVELQDPVFNSRLIWQLVRMEFR